MTGGYGKVISADNGYFHILMDKQPIFAYNEHGTGLKKNIQSIGIRNGR